MKAAVVEDFQSPPRYTDFQTPVATAGEVLVRVKASAVSQLARAQASGKHYSSGKPPLVPGVDGVGLLPDGQRVYFAFPRMPFGAMAQFTVVDANHCVEVPENVDSATAAAIANPGMSSWLALAERAHLQPGETVLVNGAAGASGRLAIRIARLLGAGKVIATARNAGSFELLRELGADVLIPLDLPEAGLRAAFREAIHEHRAGVVLDYLWGPSAEVFLQVAGEYSPGVLQPRIRYVQIGSIAGNDIRLPGALLRSSGLELLGSGLGSGSPQAIVAAAGQVFRAIGGAGLSIETTCFDLADVGSAWGHATNARLVFRMEG
ncbi:alcohol dehydrogenase [compost metagenome]